MKSIDIFVYICQALFETKMFNEGNMKNGIVKFIYKDKELLKLE